MKSSNWRKSSYSTSNWKTSPKTLREDTITEGFENMLKAVWISMTRGIWVLGMSRCYSLAGELPPWCLLIATTRHTHKSQQFLIARFRKGTNSQITIKRSKTWTISSKWREKKKIAKLGSRVKLRLSTNCSWKSKVWKSRQAIRTEDKGASTRVPSPRGATSEWEARNRKRGKTINKSSRIWSRSTLCLRRKTPPKSPK